MYDSGIFLISWSLYHVPQLQTNYIHEQPLATPTHGLLHGSSSLRLAGSQSSHLANSLDSLSHSSITSQLSTIDDTQVRKSTSNAKVPAEPTSRSVTDEGDLQQMDKQATKTLVNSMVYEDDHSVEGGQKQSYNTSGFNEYMSDDSKIHKGSRSSRSSSQSSELKSRRKKNVYSYSSSEEDGSTTLHAHPKSKGVALPPKKKTKERRISKRHNQRRVDDKTTIPHQRSKLKTGRTTSCREKAKNKQQSTSVVRSKVPLHYPGYSSGWSSSGSDTNKDNIVSTQATNGREKDKSGDQFSAPSSINSTISTSSWTSSERDNKNGEVEKDVPDVPNRPLESGHSSDSQVHKGESIADNDHSDYGGAEDTDVITNIDGQESLPLGNEGSNSAILSNSGVEDIPDTHESTPFAPDSVDLVMEPQVQRNTSEPQQLEDSELEVTIIPETQETLANDTSLQGVIECPRSPVIPLQNKNSDQFSPLHKEESQQYNTPADIIISNNKKTKTTAVFHMGLSLSDMDSHVVPLVASITSDGQVRKQIQTKLTKKRHSRRAYLHSDVGESSSTTESGGIDSCLRKRKAKLLSKILDTCRMKKHPYRRDLSRSKFDSHIGIPRSDSEFIHPSPRQLTSLSCRKRKGLKLTKVSNSVTSKTECGGEKSKQEEIPVNVQQSRLSEDEPLVHKKKSKEGDSGVSSTNLSEVAPSPGTSDAQLNLERHTVMKKSKSKKRVSREVIKISSDSDSVEFEPPPFKKRKPRPNFSQQKKQKPTPVDEAYKIINSSRLDVDDLAAAVEKQASIVTDKVKHQRLSHTTAAEVKMADQPAAHTLQHEDVEIDEAKMHLTVSTSPDEPQSRIDKVINKKARCHSDDESDSSNSSNGDRDEGVKSTIGAELSAKREIDDDMSRESKDDKTEENLSVDKLTKANDSPSTSNLSSSDESVAKPTFQGTVGIATSPFSHTDKEDRPSTFHSEQEKKIKRAASPEQQSRHRVVPLPCIDSTPNKSEPDSSDSDDNASMQGTAVLSQQPVGGGVGQLRKIAIRPTQSSPKKSSLQKNLQSYTSSVHRPPRFLFCKSNIKKNYSQQLSKLKNPVPKAQGSYESENSTGNV